MLIAVYGWAFFHERKPIEAGAVSSVCELEARGPGRGYRKLRRDVVFFRGINPCPIMKASGKIVEEILTNVPEERKEEITYFIQGARYVVYNNQ